MCQWCVCGTARTGMLCVPVRACWPVRVWDGVRVRVLVLASTGSHAHASLDVGQRACVVAPPCSSGCVCMCPCMRVGPCGCGMGCVLCACAWCVLCAFVCDRRMVMGRHREQAVEQQQQQASGGRRASCALLRRAAATTPRRLATPLLTTPVLCLPGCLHRHTVCACACVFARVGVGWCALCVCVCHRGVQGCKSRLWPTRVHRGCRDAWRVTRQTCGDARVWRCARSQRARRAIAQPCSRRHPELSPASPKPRQQTHHQLEACASHVPASHGLPLATAANSPRAARLVWRTRPRRQTRRAASAAGASNLGSVAALAAAVEKAARKKADKDLQACGRGGTCPWCRGTVTGHRKV
jgi:hypothetical protein